jgi:SAM-dependent methyltransferase
MKPADERMPSTFDAYADDYEALHAASIAASGESTAYFAQYKVDYLARLGVSRDSRVLDYGCGIGNLTEKLVTRFAHVHGYDPSAKSLAITHRRAPSAVLYDRPEAIPGRGFDAAILSGVLHHVPVVDRLGLLEHVRGALAPDGKLIVFEHNPMNPLTQRAVSQCPFDDDAVLLSPWRAKSLVRRARFSQPVVRFIVFFPKALALLRPLEPGLGWLPLGAQWTLVAKPS